MLIVVAKAPTCGQTKTRLGGLIGLEAAADFYCCLLTDVVELTQRVCDYLPDIVPAIGYWPAEGEPFFREFVPNFVLVLQEGALLGDRLHHVMMQAFSQGYTQVAVLSSDTPFVDPAALAQGFMALSDGADVALGPCDDGGFYVMHLRAPHPELLVPIQMSTPDVTRDILATANRLNLRVAHLPITTDIDTPEDVQRILNPNHPWPETVAPNTRRWLTQWQSQIQ